ncbi:chitinase, partial [Streptomyces smyrnaeus]
MLGSDRRQDLGPASGRRRRGLFALISALCAAAVAAALLAVNTSGRSDDRPELTSAARPSATDKTVGYFTNWGVYQRNYHVKNIETSGSADKLT